MNESIKELKRDLDGMKRIIEKLSEASMELEKRIRKLDGQSVEEDEWPREGEKYWTIMAVSVFDPDAFDKFDIGNCVVRYEYHCNDVVCEFNAAIGNCFRTKEDAEFAVERLKVLKEMRKFAFQPDWSNTNQMKWTLYYDYSIDNIRLKMVSEVDYGVPVHFETWEIAEECVRAVGKERLVKYYFGAK